MTIFSITVKEKSLKAHVPKSKNIQSGKLKRQPAYSSARSPLRGTMPARLRMTSSSACLPDLKIILDLETMCFN